MFGFLLIWYDYTYRALCSWYENKYIIINIIIIIIIVIKHKQVSDLNLFLNFLRTYVLFVRYPCFGLRVMSALCFKARMDPLHALLSVWSSDSPLVWHLLTVWRSAWRPSFSVHTLADISTSVGGGSGQGPNPWPSVRWAQCCIPLGHPGSTIQI